MTTLLKSLLALVSAVVIGIAIYGAYQYPKLAQVASTSAVGSTFGTQKVAEIAFAPLTSTSTSLTNTDANDRYITNYQVACTGLTTVKSAYTGGGLASTGFTLQAATSSSATASTTNTNYVLNTNIPTTTSQGVFVQASSTLALGGSLPAQVWPAGTILNLWVVSTTTATCTIGVQYIAS